MNVLPVKSYELNDAITESDIFQALSSKLSVENDAAEPSTLWFYDDFEAHLWKANYLLCEVNSECFQLIDKAQYIDEVSSLDKPRFWWQFPDSKLKDKLQKLIGLHALMPVANISLRVFDFSLRDSDEKIVVKGQLTQLLLGDKNSRYLTLHALRGYEKYFTKAMNVIQEFTKSEVENFGLRFLLDGQQIQAFEPRQYVQPLLDENMPTEQAIRLMAVALLDQAEVYVGGVVEDIDTEFLHQFRVNFRKLRSLISLLKKALPITVVALLRPRLSEIAGKTNKVRDLDVFLLDQVKYRAMLPESFKTGLDELYALIEKQRDYEKNQLAEYFSSTQYKDAIASCAAELHSEPVFQTPTASKPVLLVAKKLLLKRYHKMLAMSADITHLSADDEVHELRIEFKKLRYLVEFFVDLLPRKRTEKFVVEIKKIQAVLGNFNDYSIQITFLRSYIDDSHMEMSKALSGLIAVLHQKQKEERVKVSSVLGNFFTENMSAEVESMFRTQELRSVK